MKRSHAATTGTWWAGLLLFNRCFETLRVLSSCVSPNLRSIDLSIFGNFNIVRDFVRSLDLCDVAPLAKHLFCSGLCVGKFSGLFTLARFFSIFVARTSLANS